MRTVLYLYAFAALLTLQACQSDNRPDTEETENEEVNTSQDTPVKLIEYLVGEWELESGGGGSGGTEGAPGQRITFTSEARYIVREGNQKVDSGAYRMNQQLRHIYLESEANETPREYDIDLQQERMTLKSVATNNQQGGGGAFVYRRIGAASVPPDKSEQNQ